MSSQRLLLAAMLIAGSGLAVADEPPATAAIPVQAAVEVKPLATEASPFGDQKPVTEATLQAATGKEDVSQAVIANNTANVNNNSVNGTSVTGTISFDGGAFQNMNGLSVLTANTGNNVAINASLNVNVAIRP